MVLVRKQKKSDDASNTRDEIREEKTKKQNIKNTKSKLYVIPEDKETEIEASKRIQDILKNAETTFNLKLKTVKNKTSVNIPCPPNRKEMHEKKNAVLNSFNSRLIDSAKKVAEELGGDKEQTQKDLLNTLESFELKKGPHKKSLKSISLNDKIVDEELKKSASKIQSIISDINKFDIKRKKTKNINLFETSEGEKDLGIFDGNEEWEENVKLLIWDELEEEELKYLVTHPPRNYYEEMIQWTEEGKLWHFPIDNEQGMDEEAKVSFAEHVFLEDKLEPWCPKVGPIRHFMELVCVGLSKNPYLKVSDKHEHIYWFRDYFEEKRKILSNCGAIPAEEQEKEDSFKKAN